jgi:RNA polymerase sigma-70 factor (ECF subfamily)
LSSFIFAFFGGKSVAISEKINYNKNEKGCNKIPGLWIICMKGGTPMQNAKQLDQWIAEIAKGNTDALAGLYQETSPSVYAYALSVLKSSHDAEDVLHDCYLSVWTAASSYRSSGKTMAWLLTIAKNLCRKQLRVRSRTETWPEEDWKNSLESAEMTADDKVVLQQCMEVLSDTERQIVVLHAVSGFKHREIAAYLELPLATVLSKYHRAIKKMKTML